MDRRIRKVVHILPKMIFKTYPNISKTTIYDDRKIKRDRKLLEDVAEAVNLSPLHLCRLFRVEMNMTFKQYADNLIMEKAIEMANNGYLTISQIVDEIGAGDERNFRRRLKKKPRPDSLPIQKDLRQTGRMSQDNGDKK